DGKPYGASYRSSGPVSFAAGSAQVVFGMRHSPAGGNKMLAGTVVPARLHQRALSPPQNAVSSRIHVSDEEVEKALTPAQLASWQHDRVELSSLNEEIRRLQMRKGRKIYAVNSMTPGPTHVLIRGNVTSLGERVHAEPISALTGSVRVP